MKRTRNIIILIILVVGLSWASVGAQPILKPSEALFISVLNSDTDYLSAMLRSTPMVTDDSSGVEFEMAGADYVLTIARLNGVVVYTYTGADFQIDLNTLGTVDLYKSGEFLQIKFYN